jgi:hypothetical protein
MNIRAIGRYARRSMYVARVYGLSCALPNTTTGVEGHREL